MKSVRLMVCCLVFAACSGDAKDDVSVAPIDPSADFVEDGKADSPTSPKKGGTIRVGESKADELRASRGWIGYEIELTGGTVTFEVSGLEGSSELDSILYVFGPKSAGGRFSKVPVAFNDDSPTGGLGSLATLQVAQPGIYRVVVSSYDNYFAYPSNVTVATFTVRASCDGAFGACGPAVSDVGAACWADSDCVSAEGVALRCEGEITCAPGTECLWVREGQCVEDYRWMTTAPRQCLSNPWNGTTVTDEELEQYPSSVAELAEVAAWTRELGVTVHEVGFVWRAEPMFTCLACSCPRGDSLVVKVRTADAAVLADFGFSEIPAGNVALQLEPTQCGTNAWEGGDGTRREPQVEVELVESWLAANGAIPTHLGFVYFTEPQAICRACNCPRGDRLYVVPAENEASDHTALGFGDIYVQ